MTIRKGEAWERPLEDGDLLVPLAASDTELAALAHAALGHSTPAVLRVRGGDVSRTLGLVDGRDSKQHRFWMDLGLASLDGGPEIPFAASLIAHRSGWRGEAAAVMNAAWFGDLYLGPKAHPNDGLLDITVGNVPMRQLREAGRRAKLGTHLPHPDLSSTRAATWSHNFKRRLPVLVDGVLIGRFQKLEVRIVPDAFELVA